MNTSYRFDETMTVRRIGLGTMRMADTPDQRHGMTAPIWAPPSDRADLIDFLRRAVDLGVDHFDTADAYALGAGEELLAEALAPHRDRVLLASKIGNTRPGPAEWVPVGRPEYLRQALELSLRRLRTDRIDLLYLHRFDLTVPLEDQIGVLEDARVQGKIARIGLSGVDVAQLEAARRIAPISAVQNNFSVGDRTSQRVVEATRAAGIAFVAYFPLTAGEDPRVHEIATAHGITISQLSLAWLLHHGDHILPIPGTTHTGHLRDNLTAAEIQLTPTEVATLNAIAEAPGSSPDL